MASGRAVDRSVTAIAEITAAADALDQRFVEVLDEEARRVTGEGTDWALQ